MQAFLTGFPALSLLTNKAQCFADQFAIFLDPTVYRCTTDVFANILAEYAHATNLSRPRNRWNLGESMMFFGPASAFSAYFGENQPETLNGPACAKISVCWRGATTNVRMPTSIWNALTRDGTSLRVMSAQSSPSVTIKAAAAKALALSDA